MRKVIGDRVYVESNNSGDFLDLEKYHEDVHDPDSNLVRLEIGHSCVKTIRAQVPVEFITGMLTKAIDQHGGLREAIMALDWKEDFKEKLAAQVVELDSFNQPLPYKYLFWLDADGVAHLAVSQRKRHMIACTQATTTRGDVSQAIRADIADSWELCEECWKGVE